MKCAGGAKKGKEGRDEGMKESASQWVRHVQWNLEFGIDHTQDCGLREFTFWTFNSMSTTVRKRRCIAVTRQESSGMYPTPWPVGLPSIGVRQKTLKFYCVTGVTATEDSSFEPMTRASAAKIRSASDCFLEGLLNDEITSSVLGPLLSFSRMHLPTRDIVR